MPADNFILNPSKENSGILEFIEKIEARQPITFTTSGTTGEPKAITHSYETLVKNIKVKEELRNSIWGLTYDYTKIAGSQVILQSFLNRGKIVNLFGKTNAETVNLIEEFGVTHISATPTFYRLLVGGTIFQKVKQITLGGEPVDEVLISRIKDSFPNAKITNIYALTEYGTLFSSSNSVFEISEKNKKVIKIKNDKIFVKENDKWKNTGDAVEMVDASRFRIIGRECNMINVGGVKVNPIKVESAINKLPYVKNSHVSSQTNSVMGNIVVADIILTSDIPTSVIRGDLSKSLTSYEMPFKMNLVESIELNSTGKIIRK